MYVSSFLLEHAFKALEHVTFFLFNFLLTIFALQSFEGIKQIL
jgi:hypothetical protein